MKIKTPSCDIPDLKQSLMRPHPTRLSIAWLMEARVKITFPPSPISQLSRYSRGVPSAEIAECCTVIQGSKKVSVFSRNADKTT